MLVKHSSGAWIRRRAKLTWDKMSCLYWQVLASIGKYWQVLASIGKVTIVPYFSENLPNRTQPNRRGFFMLS